MLWSTVTTTVIADSAVTILSLASAIAVAIASCGASVIAVMATCSNCK